MLRLFNYLHREGMFRTGENKIYTQIRKVMEQNINFTPKYVYLTDEESINQNKFKLSSNP